MKLLPLLLILVSCSNMPAPWVGCGTFDFEQYELDIKSGWYDDQSDAFKFATQARIREQLKCEVGLK